MGEHGSLQFDLRLLSDPEAEGPQRETEWHRLFHTMTPRLRYYFAGRVDSADDLDDLLAAIWQRAVLRISALRAEHALWGWLVAIGVNLLRDQGRARERRDRQLGRRGSIEEVEADPTVVGRLAGDFVSAALMKEAARQVRRWVSEEDWELLQLWAVDELTHSEIADRMKLPSPEACRQRVSRLCSRLRRQLASEVKEVA